MSLRQLIFATLLALGFVCAVRGQTVQVLKGEVGQNVTFECMSLDVNDTDNTILEAYMNGQFAHFEENNDRVFRRNFGSTTTYAFGPLMSSDNNLRIRCSSAGTPTFMANISVIFAPNITMVSPSDMTFTVRENDQMSFTISITVEANPTAEYQLTRNGVPLTSTARLSFNASSITVYHLRENSGDYNVTYSNDVASVSHTFTVNVMYPPTFPANAGDSCRQQGGVYFCSANLGKNVTLYCAATGNPTPTVAFTPSSITPVDDNIVIYSASISDSGNYSCTASATGFNDVVRRFVLTVGESSAGNIVPASYMLSVLVIAVLAFLF